MRQRVIRTWWTELAAYLAFGVLGAAAACLVLSALLMGMPHGWHAATTWHHVGPRFVWLAGRTVPAAVGVYVIVRLRRDRTARLQRRIVQRQLRCRPANAPSRYRGQHR